MIVGRILVECFQCYLDKSIDNIELKNEISVHLEIRFGIPQGQ